MSAVGSGTACVLASVGMFTAGAWYEGLASTLTDAVVPDDMAPSVMVKVFPSPLKAIIEAAVYLPLLPMGVWTNMSVVPFLV